jgi:hypothetical protein
MEVEILGLLRDSLGPGKDMILARLRGAKPEYTGVVAGMSGSPVYIDGQLLGALSYRIGQFSKDPIAGITPIQQMMEVRDSDSAVAETEIAQGKRAAAKGPTEVQPMETPLVFSGGFSQDTVALFGDRFRSMGLTPVAGLGGSDAAAKQPEPLVPGSAVSAVLVRGDLSMAGTCTVTYVDPKRLLACGHPITQYGRVSMPMTKANVVATLASPLNAFKIVNTTETVGAFTEDRASAILGRFGVDARMIPVTVSVAMTGMDGRRTMDPAKVMKFEVLDNRQLTPQAMLVSVYQSLQATNVSTAEMSYRVKGEIEMKGHAAARVEGLMTQNEFNSGAINAALLVGDRFDRVYGNALDQPIVTGLKLDVDAIPERRTATLESARLDKSEVRAGEMVQVDVMIRPYQATAKMVRLSFRVPVSVSPGRLRVVVSDGATVDRLTNFASTSAQHAVGLDDMVAQINSIHENDRVYVTLLNHSPQAVLESGALGDVPISMANVLEPLKEAQRLQLTSESVLDAGQVATIYAISGSQVLQLDVR